MLWLFHGCQGVLSGSMGVFQWCQGALSGFQGALLCYDLCISQVLWIVSLVPRRVFCYKGCFMGTSKVVSGAGNCFLGARENLMSARKHFLGARDCFLV